MLTLNLLAVYLNRGPKAGAPGNWLWDGPHNLASGAPGAKASSVLFGDINGRVLFHIKQWNLADKDRRR